MFDRVGLVLIYIGVNHLTFWTACKKLRATRHRGSDRDEITPDNGYRLGVDGSLYQFNTRNGGCQAMLLNLTLDHGYLNATTGMNYMYGLYL